MHVVTLTSNQAKQTKLRSPRWSLPQGMQWLCDKGHGYGVVEPINISLTGLCVQVAFEAAVGQQWMVRICSPHQDGSWVFCPARVVYVGQGAAGATRVGLRLEPIHPAQQVKLEVCAQQWIAILCRSQAGQADASEQQLPIQESHVISQPAPQLENEQVEQLQPTPRPAALPAAAATLIKRMPVTEGEVFTLSQAEQLLDVCLVQHTGQGVLLASQTALEVGSCWLARLSLANTQLPPVVWPLRIVHCQQVLAGTTVSYRLECRFATIAMAQMIGTRAVCYTS